MGFDNIRYSKSNYYIDRKEIINKVRKNIEAEKIIVLYGMWGVGKTQLSHAYSKKYKDEYKFKIWFDAESRETLISSFVQFSKKLKFHIDGWQDEDLIQGVNEWLEAHSEWLLIIDNVNSEEEIYSYLPNNLDDERKHIIITSRNSNWNHISRSIEVKGFERNESLKLLSDKAKENYQASSSLCNLLEDHPLALDQARSYMYSRKISIEQYLERLKEFKAKLLNQGKSLDYKNSVTMTCRLAIEEIEQTSSESVELIKLLSFFSSDNISIREIKKVSVNHPELLTEKINKVLSDEILYDNLVNVITNYSILKVTENEIFSMHRLVQLIVRETLSKKEVKKYLEAASLIVIELVKNLRENVLEEINPIYSHAVIIGEHLRKEKIFLKNAIELFSLVSENYKQQALYKQSKDLDLIVLEIDESEVLLNLEERSGLLLSLAQSAFMLGQYNESEEYILMILNNEKLLDSSKILLDSYGLYYILLQNLDRFQESELIFEKYIDKVESNQDKEKIMNSEMYASVINNKGETLFKIGEIGEAQKYYEKSLLIYKNLYGENSWKVASIYSNIGHSQIETNIKMAKKNLLKSLEIFNASEKSNLSSIEMSVAKNNMGLLLLRESNINYSENLLNEALRLFKESLVTPEKIYGDNHPDIAIRLNNIGLVYADKHDNEKAIEYYTKAIEINKKIYDEPQQVIATQYFNIGSALLNLSKSYDAKVYFEKSLEIERSIYGRRSQRIVSSLYGLSRCQFETHDTISAKRNIILAYSLSKNKPSLMLDTKEIIELLMAILIERGEISELSSIISQ